ncbi:F41 fimbrial protein [Escherichia sp. E4736]|uniref:F4 family fimbrial subunit n=1 Tax=Escherichia sp. E4736 TaxID=2044466 RepID=UPI0010FD200C|nr:F41 fimbrial protein [Escherichia sp. E4736]TLI90773.1 F41 fimbrial protein [Escherichia sp. E4736]
MKKTLIALAMATSAVVSGSVMASGWTEGQPGDIVIGGEITSPSVKWLWKTGEGLSSFSNTTDEIINQQLNISVPTDELFLAARMNKGLKGVFIGNALIPKVQMASYDGSVITPNFTSNTAMNIAVKVKNSIDDTELGTLSVPLSFGAAVATIFENNVSDSNVSSIAAGSAGTVFEGLVKPGHMTNMNIAYKWNGLSATEMSSYVEKLMPGLTTTIDGSGYHNWNDLGHSNYTSATKASYLSYGSGISAGSTLVMDLNKDVSGHLEWVAPVTITVTYS